MLQILSSYLAVFCYVLCGVFRCCHTGKYAVKISKIIFLFLDYSESSLWLSVVLFLRPRLITFVPHIFIISMSKMRIYIYIYIRINAYLRSRYHFFFILVTIGLDQEYHFVLLVINVFSIAPSHSKLTVKNKKSRPLWCSKMFMHRLVLLGRT